MSKKLLTIGFSLVSLAILGSVVFTKDVLAAKYTTTQIQNELKQGVDTAYKWDDDCRKVLWSRSNEKMGNGDYRALINGYTTGTSASYKSEAWLSERGKGNTQTPTKVNYGQRNINLQLNYVMFICATLVKPDNSNVSSRTSGQIAGQNYRWVSGSNANDREPNTIGGGKMHPAQTASTIRVVSIRVKNSKPGEKVEGYNTGDLLRVRRVNNSRYWIARPVKLVYQAPPGGITSTRVVQLELKYQKIQSYHDANLNKAINRCSGHTVGNPDKPTSWGRCKVATNTLKIEFEVKPRPYNLTPSISVAPGQVKVGASEIRGISGHINNSGGPKSSKLYYTLTRFRVPVAETRDFRRIWRGQKENSIRKDAYFGCKNARKIFAGIEDCVENPVGARNSLGIALEGGKDHVVSTNRVDSSNPTKNAKVNDIICYFVTVSHYKTGKTANDWRSSAPDCVRVMPNYNLSPTSSLAVNEIAEGSDRVEGVSGAIINGGPSDSKKVDYAMSRFVVGAGARLSGGQGITSSRRDWSCDIPRRLWRARDCKEMNGSRKTNATVKYPGGATVLNNANDDITDIKDLSFGDKICYVTIVSAYNPAVNRTTFKYSTPSCALVAKRPKVQVWGGDLRVGGNSDVITRVTTINNKLYGSWGEYGIISNGRVDSASGAGLSADENGRPPTSPADYNRLTFANTFGGSNFGSYGVTPNPKSLVSYFSGGKKLNQSQFNMGTISGNQVYKRDGNLKLTGGRLRPGASAVLIVNGRVTVSKNVVYQDRDYSNINDLPQLVVIASDIVFESGVSRFDGWLISRGGVSTCGVASPSSWTSGLTAKNCNRQLRSNGPVQTSHLYLRRTFGADNTNPGRPAEVINYRLDAALWGYARSRQSGAIKTMHLKELPPRF